MLIKRQPRAVTFESNLSEPCCCPSLPPKAHPQQQSRTGALKQSTDSHCVTKAGIRTGEAKVAGICRAEYWRRGAMQSKSASHLCRVHLNLAKNKATRAKVRNSTKQGKEKLQKLPESCNLNKSQESTEGQAKYECQPAWVERSQWIPRTFRKDSRRSHLSSRAKLVLE